MDVSMILTSKLWTRVRVYYL